jgi:hypothetical protein
LTIFRKVQFIHTFYDRTQTRAWYEPWRKRPVSLQNAVDVDDGRSGRRKVNPSHSETRLGTLSERAEDCGMSCAERFPAEIPISEHIRKRSLCMEPCRVSIRVARVPRGLLLCDYVLDQMFIIFGAQRSLLMSLLAFELVVTRYMTLKNLGRDAMVVPDELVGQSGTGELGLRLRKDRLFRPSVHGDV